MKKTFLLKNLPLLILASSLLLTVAFAQTTGSKQKSVAADTLPTKHKQIRDLDEALEEIDRGEMEMKRAFQEVDQAKMESEIRSAMKNMDKDMARMKEDLAKAMQEIDMQKINLEMQKALKEIDCEKLKQEINASLSKVDMEKMKAELQKTKEINVKKMKADLANIQPEVEKAMKEAKVSIEKARQEITSYKNLVNALDKDGLLDKNAHYTIAYGDKALTVNGKKLTAEETRKYSEFLNGKENFTLQKDEDGFNIHNK